SAILGESSAIQKLSGSGWTDRLSPPALSETTIPRVPPGGLNPTLGVFLGYIVCNFAEFDWRSADVLRHFEANTTIVTALMQERDRITLTSHLFPMQFVVMIPITNPPDAAPRQTLPKSSCMWGLFFSRHNALQ
ncbi:MAG: hypothetical protein ABR971_05155, partial [Acidobacteriaceae bacterium]